MTLTQLSYIISLDDTRHFAAAAESCFVTQPTLSMQIQKLEDELGVKIFDRTKQPVIPTAIGVDIIAQARTTLREAGVIRQLINEQQDTLSGELRVGIIPTLAPYLLPPLYKAFRQKYPQLQLVVKELITEDVVYELKNNRLDCGLVVTPLKDGSIAEQVLFYEELFAYVSPNNVLAQKDFVLADDIDPDKLWLLEEGHCFRSQVLNLCELRKSSEYHFRYETGNMETLRRMVENSDGITILPELAVMEFPPEKRQLVKRFQSPCPVRQVSLVTHRHHIKIRLLEAVKDEILLSVPPNMQELRNQKVVDITY